MKELWGLFLKFYILNKVEFNKKYSALKVFLVLFLCDQMSCVADMFSSHLSEQRVFLLDAISLKTLKVILIIYGLCTRLEENF